MTKCKVEIIDNQISKGYEFNIYLWRKRKWWSIQKSWCFHYGHYIGYNYKLPVFMKQKTSKELFLDELQRTLKRYDNIVQIHRTTINDDLPLTL